MKHIKKKPKENSNILYTGFGDKGTTTLFGCKQERISKSAHIIEALGAVDELNAYLGVVKVYSMIDKLNIEIKGKKITYDEIINEIQQNLFIIQAEIAGSDMTINKKEVNKIERIIKKISDSLPSLKSFTVAGGSILSADLDVARTLARRAERRIVSVLDEKSRIIGTKTIAYMNRLSSVLFAMSRYTNYLLSIPEDYPRYNKK